MKKKILFGFFLLIITVLAGVAPAKAQYAFKCDDACDKYQSTCIDECNTRTGGDSNILEFCKNACQLGAKDCHVTCNF